MIGPKSTAPSWICCATSRSPPSVPEWWWAILILPPDSSVNLSANCWDACDVPCLGGLTLPMLKSWAAAGIAVSARATQAMRMRRSSKTALQPPHHRGSLLFFVHDGTAGAACLQLGR